MNNWFYFGCDREAGHYLFGQGMRRGYTYGDRLCEALGHFDGCLCLPKNEGLYRASLTRLGGLGYSALAFWDCTVDKRSGSNSIFFAPSLKCSPETIMRGAEKFFPAVFARLPAIDLSKALVQVEAMRA